MKQLFIVFIMLFSLPSLALVASETSYEGKGYVVSAEKEAAMVQSQSRAPDIPLNVTGEYAPDWDVKTMLSQWPDGDARQLSYEVGWQSA